MKLVKWKVSEGSRLLDAGSKWSESDRLVLDEILAREVGSFDVKPERSYRIEAGELIASSYGDEFERTREAAYLDDAQPLVTGHHFGPPPGAIEALPESVKEKLAERLAEKRLGVLGCPHRDMNDEELVGSEVHAKCADCGFVDPKPCRRATFSERMCLKPVGRRRGLTEEELQSQADALGDSDRAREERMLRNIGRAVAKDLAKKVLNDLLAKNPVVVSPPCKPSDHRIVEEQRPTENMTRFHCVVCKRDLTMADVELRSIYPNALEPIVRDRLTRIGLP